MTFKNWTMRKDNMNDEEYAAVADWCNQGQKFHIDDKGDYYAVVPNPEPTEADLAEFRIAELKDKLNQTDYVVIKIAEGSATAEEYAEVLENRKAWRSEINELEEKLTLINNGE